jgi:DNA-directed RNA polymerase-5 subunit 1
VLFSCELFLGYLSHILLKDPYIEPKVVKLPSEVANRITFEEQATDININILQEVVDK